MVLDALGVGLGGFVGHPDGDEKVVDEEMTLLGPFRDRAALLGEEDRAVGWADDVAALLKPPDRLPHRDVGHAHRLREIDGAGLPALSDEGGDRLQVVLGAFPPMVFPGSLEAVRRHAKGSLTHGTGSTDGVQALVFDFDGTLVDTETPELTVWRETFAAHGVELPAGYWSNIVGRGAEQEFERPAALLERLTGKPYRLDGDRHDRTMAMIQAAPLRPGVLSLLQEARAADIPCAVASSSKHPWVDPGLRSRGIDGYFQAVVCADDVARAKPWPDLFLEACRRLGSEPSKTIAIEDSPNGLAAAKAAGLFALVTPNPVTQDLDLSAAALILPDLTHTSLQALVQR